MKNLIYNKTGKSITFNKHSVPRILEFLYKNNCPNMARYHQISAIFQAFLLNFPLFFSPGGSPVSIKWPSSVLYGNFTFSFTHLSYTKQYKKRKNFHFKTQELVAQWQGSGMPCGRLRFNSPSGSSRLFHLSHISIVDISGKSHRSTDTYT